MVGLDWVYLLLEGSRSRPGPSRITVFPTTYYFKVTWQDLKLAWTRQLINLMFPNVIVVASRVSSKFWEGWITYQTYVLRKKKPRSNLISERKSNRTASSHRLIHAEKVCSDWSEVIFSSGGVIGLGSSRMKGDRGSGLGMGRSISFYLEPQTLPRVHQEYKKAISSSGNHVFSGDIYDCCMFPDLNRGESINEGL